MWYIAIGWELCMWYIAIGWELCMWVHSYRLGAMYVGA